MKSKNILDQIRIEPNEQEDLLRKLQANILKNHGRNYLALLLLQFNERQLASVKKILGALNITSAWQQIKDANQYAFWRAHKDQLPKPNPMLQSLYLTSLGYEVLQIEHAPLHSPFTENMASRALGDTPKEEWEAPFAQDIHGMLLLGNDLKAELEEKVHELKKEWEKAISIIHVQYGSKLINEHKDTIEHFGYVDGISQPLFLASDFHKKKTAQWNAEAPLRTVLVPDPGTNEKNAFGSYLVYRKLEQNVHAFKTAEKELAKHLGFAEQEEEMAGALMIGRFENGLPVLKLGSVAEPEAPSKDNDFNYAIDPDGVRCPFHAHIRRVNPRGDSMRAFQISDQEERSRRIARRGITYDEIGRNGNLDYEPESGVGLLFLCFQSDIEQQFEFIQKMWANNNDFPRPFTGIDPIIGQGHNRKDINGKDAEQKWTNIHGEQIPKALSSFVKLLGGAYFFAPSLPFIQGLTSPAQA